MTGNTEPKQLPLNIRLDEEATFNNYFVTEPNLQTIELIQQQCEPSAGEQFIFLWGSQGSGCSHLLQAACHEAEQKGFSPIYFPLRELAAYAPSLLDNLEGLDLVCLDNIEAIIGNEYWEQALFHCFNRLRDSAVKLLMTGDNNPQNLPIELADLRSRLSWGMTCQLKDLDDDEKVLALQFRAKKRGLLLQKDVAQFIFQRHARNTSALFDTLSKLDEASLSAKRRLTIPFVKQILNY